MQTVSVYELAHQLLSAGVPVEKVATRVGRDRATIYRWKKAIRYRGIKRFVGEKKEAKRKRKRQILDARVVKLIKKSRDDHADWCGEKIVWDLKTNHDVVVSRASVYRILNRYYKLRSNWKKNRSRGKLPRAIGPREVIQVDTVDYGGLFAYTAIDIFTREAAVVLGYDLTDEEGGRRLAQVFTELGSTHTIQTDNGGEFGQAAKPAITSFSLTHHRNHPGKKNENCYIESFNRSFRKECLGWEKFNPEERERLQQRVNTWITWYNTKRPHLGLNMKRPVEVYKSHLR